MLEAVRTVSIATEFISPIRGRIARAYQLERHPFYVGMPLYTG